MKPVPEEFVRDGRADRRRIALLFAGSAILAVSTAMICYYARSEIYPGESVIPDLLYGTLLWFWWGAVAALMFPAARRWPSLFRFSTLNLWGVLGHVVAAGVFAIVHLVLMVQLIRFLSRHWTGWDPANFLFPGRFGLEMLLYAFVFGIVGTYMVRSQERREAMQRLELEKQLSQARLKALETQIEPHFLFNTLNALTTLVETGRNREASEMLGHLNKILRSTLERRAEKIPFAQELQVIESYLAIQQVRFADRLKVKIETSAEALEGLVPCFLLQPIVENAIRHGIAPLEGDGVLETSVDRVGEMLRMRVRDNGPGLNGAANGNGKMPENGYGIGMRNTRERLSFLYPGAYEFVARDIESGGCEVTIQIPYERRGHEA
jgi:signal transduction histidine kinase